MTADQMSEPGRQVPEEMFATPTIGSEKDPEADNKAGIEDQTDARHMPHHVSHLDADIIGLVLRHRNRGTQDAGQMTIDIIDKMVITNKLLETDNTVKGNQGNRWQNTRQAAQDKQQYNTWDQMNQRFDQWWYEQWPIKSRQIGSVRHGGNVNSQDTRTNAKHNVGDNKLTGIGLILSRSGHGRVSSIISLLGSASQTKGTCTVTPSTWDCKSLCNKTGLKPINGCLCLPSSP